MIIFSAGGRGPGDFVVAPEHTKRRNIPTAVQMRNRIHVSAAMLKRSAPLVMMANAGTQGRHHPATWNLLLPTFWAALASTRGLCPVCPVGFCPVVSVGVRFGGCRGSADLFSMPPNAGTCNEPSPFSRAHCWVRPSALARPGDPSLEAPRGLPSMSPPNLSSIRPSIP